MRSKNIILLKTLLKSTSQWNQYRYSKDKKKRGRVIGNTIGFGILYLLLAGYCVAMAIGYGWLGMIDCAPIMCAMVISLLAFVFTLFKTNGYLFAFKEYDMLMALPFESKAVASCKFLYMYVKSMPWYAFISLPIMVVYGVYKRPNLLVYPLWVVLTLFVPVIPMVIAAFIGFVIAKISARFRKTKLIQTILMFAFIIVLASSQFIIQSIFEKKQVEIVLGSIADVIDKIGKVYAPAKWFSDAVVELNIAGILLLVGVTILLYEVVMLTVGKSYRKINSALKSHAASKKYEMAAMKKSKPVIAIAFKEYRRLVGSTIYMTNAGLGDILAVLLGIVVLIFGFDRMISVVTKGAPIPTQILYPAIPLIVYFLVGMVATTAVSPSLEGKNYWIVQSLPIEKKVLYQGKMLFDILLRVPAMVFAVLCLCISARVSVFSTILYLILGVVLCGFSSAWGCVCGVKHMRLDWENEIEVVKQGTAVTIYLLPNMFITMGLTVAVVALGMKMNADLILAGLTVVVLVLTVLSYLMVLSLAKSQK